MIPSRPSPPRKIEKRARDGVFGTLLQGFSFPFLTCITRSALLVFGDLGRAQSGAGSHGTEQGSLGGYGR